MIRKDIQILRGISVLAVVFYHANFLGFDHGYIGVDIFFVISGYLILGKIFRDLSANRFSLTDFWGRRIRRLLPAASTTILLTLLLAPLFLTKPDLRVTREDSIFSALNIVNWHFANQEIDYWSIETISPFLHFWSLSVEEQFYFVAPIFLLLLFKVFYKVSSIRNITIISFAILGIISFNLMWLEKTQISNLYFNSVFRVWEFVVGGIVALIASQAGRIAKSLKWLTLVGLFLTMTLEYEVTYPGATTLIPVFFTAIYLGVSDFNDSKIRITNSLANFWVRVGDASYSIYLWHWPITIFALAYFQGIKFTAEKAEWHEQLLIVLVSAVAGWFSYKYVETPFRHIQISRFEFPKLATVAIASFAVVFSTQHLVAEAPIPNIVPRPVEQIKPIDNYNGLVPNPDFVEIFANLSEPNLDPAADLAGVSPKVTKMTQAKAIIYNNGCNLEASSFTYPETCVFGDMNSDVEVMLVGDSHAANWFAAINAASKANNIKLYSRTKSSCGVLKLYVREDVVEHPNCLKWRDEIKREITALQPDLVIVGQLLQNTQESYISAATRRSYSEFKLGVVGPELNKLAKIAPQILFVHDIPKLGFEPVKCLRTFTPADCLSDRKSNELDPTAWNVELAPNIREVNFNDRICAAATCSASDSDYIIYRDSHHITAEFSASLSPIWQQVLRQLLA